MAASGGPAEGGVTIEYADAAPSGLASLVGGLIQSNLARDPARRVLLRPARIGIAAPDAGVAVTLEIAADRVRVRDGVGPGAVAVLVTADSRSLLDLASAPLRLGLPDPLRPQGRRVLRAVLAGRVRVSGLLRHPLALSRLARLLSAG